MGRPAVRETQALLSRSSEITVGLGCKPCTERRVSYRYLEVVHVIDGACRDIWGEEA